MVMLSTTPKNAREILIDGEVGKIDCLELMPATVVVGVAIIFHPDPAAGGNNTHKVVQTLAKYLNALGYICYCPNSRGIGKSAGIVTKGVGEITDAIKVYDYVINKYPQLAIILSGFSFGTYIASNLAGIKPNYKHLILLGPAVTRYEITIPHKEKVTVIHGALDEVIDLSEVLAWGNKQDVVINVFPNAGHFFHGKLQQLVALLNSYKIG